MSTTDQPTPVEPPETQSLASDTPTETTSQPTTARDAAYWARPVTSLTVEGERPGALNLNVQGRRLSSPIQGFGRMWRKVYQIRLSGADVTPEQVISTWRDNFASFWPKGNRFYGPLTGLKPGEVALINSNIPGGMRLSTGVMVLYADDVSFTLMTPEGHIFAGFITFSSHVENGVTVAQVDVLLRASDPVYEIGLVLIGHRQEDLLWTRTLRNIAVHFGVQATATAEAECLDKRYQWGQARNVWHNAAIRTGLYYGTAPLRLIVRRFSRPSVPAGNGSAGGGATGKE